MKEINKIRKINKYQMHIINNLNIKLKHNKKLNLKIKIKIN